ncbi:hypothetical protein WAF17_01305 [Bernardetia sp. ABR2-2B]|uniref:hypothetical protein n=1 Tax=Bernardetia sp. ABR2-2B TaxID=3127472 RepID=UPI0030D05C83
MNRNQVILALSFIFLAVGLFSFTSVLNKTSTKEIQDEVTYEYMQINVLESVVSGGLGRSRMIVTRANGKADKPINMENYYSAVGINFNNISENDEKVVVMLNMLGKEGWEVEAVTSGGNQVYFTKYVLKREKK